MSVSCLNGGKDVPDGVLDGDVSIECLQLIVQDRVETWAIPILQQTPSQSNYLKESMTNHGPIHDVIDSGMPRIIEWPWIHPK